MHRFNPPPDAETQWREFANNVQTEWESFFDGLGPIVGARAPGRLDVLGGVADYSGSIVLEMPIAEAALVAWQWRSDRVLRLRSVDAGAAGLATDIDLSLDNLVLPDGAIRPPEDVRARLHANPKEQWAQYIAGCFYVMMAAHSRVAGGRANARIGEFGANVLIDSSVPPGAGVSSSAALEVAAMHALSEAAGIHPSDLTLAAWCQRAENSIVGAPCGIMDQVTAALGRPNSLVVLQCQPHNLLGSQPIPSGWQFVGIDAGVKHSVAGSRYTGARVGAFMGLKVIQLESGGKLLDNYLCQMAPEEFLQYREMIPETIRGSVFQAEYGILPDNVTRIDPNEVYHPRSCAEHPILENDRAKRFLALLEVALAARYSDGAREHTYGNGPDSAGFQRDDLMTEAGKLMYESHASYTTRLDLGSSETDLIVNEVRLRGSKAGLYGAKITGGGAGGTVAVLCANEGGTPLPAIIDVCTTYERQTGKAPRLFVGSSPGAVPFGARPIPRG